MALSLFDVNSVQHLLRSHSAITHGWPMLDCVDNLIDQMKLKVLKRPNGKGMACSTPVLKSGKGHLLHVFYFVLLVPSTTIPRQYALVGQVAQQGQREDQW